MENLKIWKEVEKTDPAYTKNVEFGAHKFTSINAQYQLKNATAQFGMYGSGFGIKKIEHKVFDGLANNEILILGNAIFFYVIDELEENFPISSTIKMQSYSHKNDKLTVDDEWAKKLETDITTKALAKLGFNADVFLGRYDDNRYVNQVREDFTPKKELPGLVKDSENWKLVLSAIEGGKVSNVSLIEKKYKLSPENQKALESLINAKKV